MTITTAKLSMKQTEVDLLSDYSIQLNRWFLKPIVVPCILYVIYECDDAEMRVMMMGPLNHWFVGGINYTTLLFRGKDIQHCVKIIQTDWRAAKRLEDQRIMLTDAKFGRYVAVVCAVFMQGGVMYYCVTTGLTTEIVQVGNETRIIRLLPCAAYTKLLPVNTSPTNEIIFVIQLFSGFIVNSTAVGAFSLAVVFAAHAYGQLNVLMMWITELVNQSRGHKKDIYFNYIAVVVEKHLRILSFISRIEDIMSKICFMELFKCTFCICMLGYYVLMHAANHDYQEMITCIVILISMAFNVFIVCYIGEQLSEQCKKVGEAVYMTEWYYLPEREILDLILIISRSNVAIKMTAGKFFEMSLVTFTTVMKTAFAYLNVLRQMV
ncbi:odorant receptor 13a-like [Osmia bicornis bicornis]|uniref:odorant receptor 13a-like n=1 Tax=Osmia bicornis bicornis TaxID=1437191 RepID=UPI001EAF26A8|nr:odorant receptor 13a-like [Osmia bicornis bicornis]